MQFNQVNKNAGDVNNAISERGDVVQTVGDGNKVQANPPKPSFWSMLWTRVKSCWKWLRG